MADKLLRSIKFPTLPDRYVIGDTSLSEEGAAAEAKAVGDALATKADTKGTYEDLIVGGAEQLMADEYETDKEPYLFRTTGGSADVGNREYLDSIVGGTVAWNQFAMFKQSEYTSGSIGVTYTPLSYSSFRLHGTISAVNDIYLENNAGAKPFILGHKYIVWVYCKDGSASDYFTFHQGTRYYPNILNAPCVFEHASNATQYDCIKTLQTGDVDYTFYWNKIDLTQLFGSTIADYIYNLEQSQAGAGVAWFRQYFPKNYYPYDPGTLRSVEGVSAHEMVGFNQWDEETLNGYYDTNGLFHSYSSNLACKNLINVKPNATYHLHCGYARAGFGRICFYDSGSNCISTRNISGSIEYDATMPENCHYFAFDLQSAYGATYKNDICINLSDPTRNGEYEPYQKHTYPLDSSLTLRGVPKLVDGKLAFDGDIYLPSGVVQRRYGLRAYQSGDESLTDAITDGTNTVYKLTTPTTETAEGYEQYQICDPSGTEAFVTTGIVPVGHETRYPHDLKKKIETAPDSPSTDGTYLMKRSGGKNTYMALPSTPSANGAYVLTVTVSGGTASYSWTAKG